MRYVRLWKIYYPGKRGTGETEIPADGNISSF
jgi:hypothetical protein